MATRSSILAWRIPGTEELGGLPSMGSQSRTRLKRLSSTSSRESGEEVRSGLLAPGGSTELAPRPRPRGDPVPEEGRGHGRAERLGGGRLLAAGRLQLPGGMK